MLKIFNKWFLITKREKDEIDLNDRQYELALVQISRLEKELKLAIDENEKQIELKNNYIQSCQELRLKFNKVKKQFKDLKKQLGDS